jgi:hypothetical protein
MGRKSSAKGQHAAAPPPPEPPSSGTSRTVLIVFAAIAVIAIGTLAYRHQQSAPDPEAAAAAATPVSYPQAITKPHPQQNLPALQFPAYPTPRPPETIRAAYQFAAEHPEVLSYVPCFCGCEHAGHRANEDCFIRERTVDGDVVAWDDHGMECTICLDVADRSRKLFEGGKSPQQIRAAIEQEFGGHGPTHTPTPQPPSTP